MTTEKKVLKEKKVAKKSTKKDKKVADKTTKATKNKKNMLKALDIKRSITPTPFKMYSELGDNSLEPIKVQRSTFLCTKSHCNADENEVHEGNPQRSETANLSGNSNVLAIIGSVSFTSAKFGRLKVQRFENDLGAEAGGDAQDKLKYFLKEALTIGSKPLEAISLGYAKQIANAELAFRNLDLMQRLEVRVKYEQSNTVEGGSIVFKSVADNTLNIVKLASLIALALSGGPKLHLLIDTRIRYSYEGIEVYPSQEFSEATGEAEKLGRTYAKDASGHAYIHSQKAGNAVRTIDTWYSDDADFALPVDPFGPCKYEAKCYRLPNKGKSLYDLLTRIYGYSFEKIDEMPDNEKNFVLACWVRGGLYGITPPKTEEKSDAVVEEAVTTEIAVGE